MFVRDGDVEALRAFSQQQPPREATDKTWVDGQAGRVVVGPFAGYRCVVVQVTWSRQARARVRIDMGGRSFDIASIPLAFLEKL